MEREKERQGEENLRESDRKASPSHARVASRERKRRGERKWRKKKEKQSWLHYNHPLDWRRKQADEIQ